MAFDFGRVVRRTFDPLKENPATFFGIAFLLSALPGLAIVAMQSNLQQSAGIGASLGGNLLGGILGMILGALTQGALIYAAVEHYRGRKAPIGASLRTAFARLLPIVVVGFLYGLAVTVGLFLLVIPGLLIAVIWLVVIPATVVEKKGIGEAFGRSRELTKGSFWPLFGLVVLYVILSAGIGFLAVSLTGMSPATGAITITPAYVVLQLVSATVTGAIAAAGVAAVYYELRQNKDGVGAEDLADVFA